MRVKKAWKDSACLACCTTVLALAAITAPALSAGGGAAERGMVGRINEMRGALEMRGMNAFAGSGGRAAPPVIVFHGGFTPHMTPPPSMPSSAGTLVREPEHVIPPSQASDRGSPTGAAGIVVRDPNGTPDHGNSR